MSVDIRLIECFVAIAEEGSFTAAADRLGIAQSAASERLRRLEDLFGVTLIARTSRRVSLAPAGTRLLDSARRLIDGERDILRLAHEVRAELDNRLRLGSFEWQPALPIRQRLIAAFLDHRPEVWPQTEHGTMAELLGRLRDGEIDVLLVQSMAPRGEADLVQTPLAPLHAHLLVPAEDDLSGQPEIGLAALRERTILLSPGRTDPLTVALLRERFEAAGARILTAPDADRQTIEHFARLHRMICLRWLTRREQSHDWHDMRVVPVEQGGLRANYEAIVARSNGRALVTDFIRFAAAWAAAGD